MTCGDRVCEENENCGQDSCCKGVSVFLERDSNNCGTCGHQCKEGECINGNCIFHCGNGYCESKEIGICAVDCHWCGDGSCNATENYEICPEDCERSVICGDEFCSPDERCCFDCGGCKEGEECIYDRCLKRGQPVSEEKSNGPNGDFTETEWFNQTTTSPLVDKAAGKEQKIVIIEYNKSSFEKIIEWFLTLFSGWLASAVPNNGK
jgi:hypothetical protein